MINTHNLPAPSYISTQAEVQHLTEILQREKKIAVDTESDSLYVYQEKVCLIQFSTSSTDYLVDPLSGIDVSPLGAVFADPSILKIFHAAEYDVICLRRDYNFDFNNLFDTMQAARVMGLPKLGLSSLLEEYFSVLVNKRYQKANWGKRPLSPEMLDYARLDTHYLIALQKILYAELVKMDRLKVAGEDFLRISQSVATPNEKPCYNAVRGYHTLNPQQLAVLKELCTYRERQAFQANLPPFKILNSSVLLEAARQAPSTRNELAGLPGLSEKLLRRHAAGLLEAVAFGQTQPPIHLNHRTKPSETYIKRLEKLKKWRLQRAREKGVESDVVLPREKLEEIARVNPQTDKELGKLMSEMPERFRLYHQFILIALHGGK